MTVCDQPSLAGNFNHDCRSPILGIPEVRLLGRALHSRDKQFPARVGLGYAFARIRTIRQNLNSTQEIPE